MFRFLRCLEGRICYDTLLTFPLDASYAGWLDAKRYRNAWKKVSLFNGSDVAGRSLRLCIEMALIAAEKDALVYFVRKAAPESGHYLRHIRPDDLCYAFNRWQANSFIQFVLLLLRH